MTIQIDQPPDILKQLFINLTAPIPLELVVSLCIGKNSSGRFARPLMRPNIEIMRITGAKLTEGFLQPNPGGPYADTKLLPSLRLLRLEYAPLQGHDDWGYLTTYLTHQSPDGWTISMELTGRFHASVR